MKPRALAAEALLLLLLLPAAAAADSWRVAVHNVDTTRLASCREARGVVLVDVASLAPALGLVVRISRGVVTLRDRDGRIWSVVAGESRLTASGEEIDLEVPPRLESRSVYLPVAAVAELAGLSLLVDAAARRIDLLAIEAGETRNGWQSLTITRPPASADTKPGSGPDLAAPSAVLPPEREALRLGLALGHVLGADWGGELTASGSVRGWETRAFGLLTQGSAGLELQDGQIAVTEPVTGRGGEAGNLFSEIWGSAQGARLSWSRGSSLALYLADEREGRDDPVLAYQDELALGESAGLAGEVATDGSWLLRGHWQRGRFGLFGYWRDDARGGGEGVSGALDLPWGAGLQAAWSRGGTGRDLLEQVNWSLRVPLLSRAELGVEGTRLESRLGEARSQALLLGALLGPVRLRVRWQTRSSEGRALPGRWPVRLEQDELRATATLAAGPRLAFELQSASRWGGAGSADPWQQLSVSWRPLDRTTLQVWALSSGAPLDDPLRLRLTQDLPGNLSLLAEYGRIPSFQEEEEGWSDTSHLKLLVRRTWQVGTPAGGGTVEGRVASALGPPPAGTPVELGPYRALTAPDGRFAFRHLPPGRYGARVPEASLPVSWAAPGERPIEVRGQEKATLDLELIPLGHVSGRVWEDLDGDGRPAPGEGVAGAVVRLGERATRSDVDGIFGFFNLPSGSYRLEIDPERLPPGFALAVPSRVDLGLPPGASLDGVGLRMERRKRPVVFQELS
jgi:hypothetical protein